MPDAEFTEAWMKTQFLQIRSDTMKLILCRVCGVRFGGGGFGGVSVVVDESVPASCRRTAVPDRKAGP
ncbi:MAG: hypothetical protein KDA96_00865 [Planctomycetaceae bacterium]|nr:hypothetical protein [Planctomycetaceae bacterium]